MMREAGRKQDLPRRPVSVLQRAVHDNTADFRALECWLAWRQALFTCRVYLAGLNVCPV